MKKTDHTRSRGQVLHKLARISPMSLKDIIQKAGYKYPTFYVHVKRADLPFEILARYGKAMNHDFSKEFPEMAEYVIKDQIRPSDSDMTEDELLKERNHWKARYFEQTERYRILSDKYNRLLEEQLGFQDDQPTK